MLQQLVIGFDASTESGEALRWAGSLGDSDTRLLLAYASHAGDALGVGEQQRVHEEAIAFAEAAGGRDVSFIARAGDPATVLADVAREADADLVVIGHPRPEPDGSTSGRLLAVELLQRSRAAVAVVPAHSPPVQGGTSWLVGVDGSEASAEALVFLEDVAVPPERVRAILAYDPTADSFPHPAGPSWTYPGEGEARAQLSLFGDGNRLELEAGELAEVLRRRAQEGASVIVTGARHGLLANVLGPGRAPSDLVVSPPCPVVIVPEGASSAEGTAPADDEGIEHVDRRGDETVVRTENLAAARDLVARAEQQGGESSRLHIDTVPSDDAVSMQRNDHANLASVSRPALRNAVIGALALGGVLLVGSLIAGASSQFVIILALGGAIVGAVLGAFVGMYRHIVINRDVIDLRGQRQGSSVVVREEQHAGSSTDEQGVGYVEEQRRRDDTPRRR